MRLAKIYVFPLFLDGKNMQHKQACVYFCLFYRPLACLYVCFLPFRFSQYSPPLPKITSRTIFHILLFLSFSPPLTLTHSALAEKCHAYAKALHYKELEFHTQPAATIEALISINNQLQQPEVRVLPPLFDL